MGKGGKYLFRMQPELASNWRKSLKYLKFKKLRKSKKKKSLSNLHEEYELLSWKYSNLVQKPNSK